MDIALMESAVGLCKSELVKSRPAYSGRAEPERETTSWADQTLPGRAGGDQAWKGTGHPAGEQPETG